MADNKSYTIKLGVGYDAAILGKLESVKNKSSYIKELVRKDIDGKLKPVTEFTKATEEKAEEYSNITEEKYKEQFDNNMEKSVNFITNTIKDIDVIGKLSSMENKSEYIRRLILVDIGLVNQEGKRFILSDGNGNVRSEKRTISERRKEREKGYIQGEEARFNKQKYDNEYRKKHYKILSINIKIDEYEDIRKHIQQTNENNTEFIQRAIKETMERDSKRITDVVF